MEKNARIKRMAREQLQAKRPRFGVERQYPEDMGLVRRIASRVFSITDPVVESQGVQHSRSGANTYIGEKVVRRSGIVEVIRAVPVVPSAEGVRFAYSTLPTPGFVYVGEEPHEPLLSQSNEHTSEEG